jgi:hypothetical protein
MTILVALATSGFWLVGHSEYVRYPDYASCERARPLMERDMVAHGYEGVRTMCRGPE